MGLFSSSKKRTTVTNQTFADNSVFQPINPNDAIVFGEGNVLIQTDQGAIKEASVVTGRALAAGVDIAGRGLRSADDAIRRAADVSYASIDSNERVNRDSLRFAGDTVYQMRQQSRDAIEETGRAGREALSFGRAALSGQERAGREALSFGRAALSGQERAGREALRFGESALYEVRQAGENAFGFGENVASAALSFARDSLQTTEKGFDQAIRVTRSDTAETMQESVKWIAGALVVSGLAMVIFRK